MIWRTRFLGLAFAIVLLAVAACGGSATATPSASSSFDTSSGPTSVPEAEERVLKVAMTFLDEPPDPYQAGWLAVPTNGACCRGPAEAGRQDQVFFGRSDRQVKDWPRWTESQVSTTQCGASGRDPTANTATLTSGLRHRVFGDKIHDAVGQAVRKAADEDDRLAVARQRDFAPPRPR